MQLSVSHDVCTAVLVMHMNAAGVFRNVMVEVKSQEAADACVLENGEMCIEGQKVSISKALTQLQPSDSPDAAEEEKKRRSYSLFKSAFA